MDRFVIHRVPDAIAGLDKGMVMTRIAGLAFMHQHSIQIIHATSFSTSGGHKGRHIQLRFKLHMLANLDAISKGRHVEALEMKGKDVGQTVQSHGLVSITEMATMLTAIPIGLGKSLGSHELLQSASDRIGQTNLQAQIKQRIKSTGRLLAAKTIDSTLKISPEYLMDQGGFLDTSVNTEGVSTGEKILLHPFDHKAEKLMGIFLPSNPHVFGDPFEMRHCAIGRDHFGAFSKTLPYVSFKLTDQAKSFRSALPAMLIGQQIVGQRWSVRETLQHRVEETGVPKVGQPRADRLNTLPFQHLFHPISRKELI